MSIQILCLSKKLCCLFIVIIRDLYILFYQFCFVWLTKIKNSCLQLINSIVSKIIKTINYNFLSTWNRETNLTQLFFQLLWSLVDYQILWILVFYPVKSLLNNRMYWLEVTFRKLNIFLSSEGVLLLERYYMNKEVNFYVLFFKCISVFF